MFGEMHSQSGVRSELEDKMGTRTREGTKQLQDERSTGKSYKTCLETKSLTAYQNIIPVI